VSYRREVTTLGRGGSDTTAVAMAAALGAEWCEICSDVDGVYTTDPRVVPAARRIGTLNYEETQEMAEAGAKVLNAQAVEFAKQHGIAIYARATSGPLPGPDPSLDGTVVRKNAPRPPGTVVGVASEKDVLVLQAQGACASELLAFLDEREVCGKQLHVARYGPGAGSDSGPMPDALTMVLSRENLHDEDRFRRGLAERCGESARLIEAIGAVSVIGAGINTSYRNVRIGSAALGAAGIEPSGLSTSSFRISWLLPDTAINDAVRALHRVFIEEGAQPVP
jgi:aspartate kinase